MSLQSCDLFLHIQSYTGEERATVFHLGLGQNHEIQNINLHNINCHNIKSIKYQIVQNIKMIKISKIQNIKSQNIKNHHNITSLLNLQVY